jgi:hypothetical protein
LGCETSRLLLFLDIWLIDGCEVVSLTRLTSISPRKIPGTHFCKRFSRPRTIVQLEGLGKLKNRNNEPSLTTAFKRTLLPRIIHYMFRLQFKPSSGVSNQNTKSGYNGCVVGNESRDLQACSIVPQPTTLQSAYGYVMYKHFRLTA